MYDSFKSLKLDKRGKILTITLDNPPLNANEPGMHGELARIFHVINHDPDTAVVIITGAGEKAFSAGGDIKNMAARIERGEHEDWIRGNREAKEIIYSMLRLEKPLIARVNGHAMGLGASLAVMADFSYMVEHAQIADTHVKVGLAAGDGGAFMWPMLIGFTNARRYLLTGDAMTGAEAAQIGLITQAVADIPNLDRAVNEMADRLANGATLAINTTKAAINLLLRRMLDGVMEAHLGAETYTYLSKDHYEAVTAFRDKRVPIFTGR
ncbi:enoyl-CoA hydratase/isomerase family protein [Rhizorhabdus dicambivorans]|uniref:Enoyl-CoA hydratase n=1 Tax=Rhizorhabdus dicambivorans TaxID=1850238 RepID=A0A2A4FQZ8_9SPHN|nr:enoyl-CoA hydratase-related protein [Rhizorhabdus dicambivorans]ATE66317.1 enoyl-CoA hydratase [Rhizorhabdus dicambivorans]PCE40150.1 enoyl-CoA hydratase [Rhizorhabdus dicambivorans]